MIRRLLNWFRPEADDLDSTPADNLRRSGAYRQPPARPTPRRAAEPVPNDDIVELEPSMPGEVEEQGPGKNVLIRNRFVREDTGTHETLKILDDSIVDSGEETGIDPYNTGDFDRSKNWDKRFR